MKKKVKILLMVLFTVIYVIAVWRLNQIDKTEIVNREGQTFEKGIVTEILRDNIQENGMREGEQRVVVKMTTGSHKGEELETTSSSGMLFGAACTVGMHVIVMQSVAGDTVVTSVYAQDRELQIYLFAALYFLTIILIGGWKGFKGALALLFTMFTAIFLYLPLIYMGYSPFLVAVVICAVTTIVTMLLIGGWTEKTLAAILGTVAGVVAAGVIARLFGLSTGLSGWNVSNIENLMTLYTVRQIRVGGLLFAGLLISALGAIMDVAMSISSSMEEVLRQNPRLTRGELWKSGMRIGRDLMGTDSNTLILAFAGGSLSDLVLDFAYDLPYQQIINSNNIGLAIMKGLSGSFGVVLAVPLTVTIASLLFRKKAEAVEDHAGIQNGKSGETLPPEGTPLSADRT